MISLIFKNKIRMIASTESGLFYRKRRSQANQIIKKLINLIVMNISQICEDPSS